MKKFQLVPLLEKFSNFVILSSDGSENQNQSFGYSESAKLISHKPQKTSPFSNPWNPSSGWYSIHFYSWGLKNPLEWFHTILITPLGQIMDELIREETIAVVKNWWQCNFIWFDLYDLNIKKNFTKNFQPRWNCQK